MQLADAIWRDDLDAVRALVTRNPALIHEHVLIRTDSNWGPPMTYAANLGRDGIIRLLHSHGAKDLESAAGRAALQGKADTVRMIHDLAGRPSLEKLTLAGPAYTLSVEGTAVLLALGARVVGPDGVDHEHHGAPPRDRQPEPARQAPHPGDVRRARLRASRHAGDGAPSRAHRPARGAPRARSGSPHAHVRHRRRLPARPCLLRAMPYTAQGTPVHGTTLLHIAAYFDELEIAEWLLDRGMNPDARAAIDADGFGGYTALFSTVVSQHNFWVNYGKGQPDEARFTRLLLDRGADPNIRASLRQRLEEGHGGGPLREYRDVTPLGWGEQFHAKIFVSRESMRLIEARGGGR